MVASRITNSYEILMSKMRRWERRRYAAEKFKVTVSMKTIAKYRKESNITAELKEK